MAADRSVPPEAATIAQLADAVELRELETMDELRPLERLQREVWGIEDVEVVPASAMRAAVHAGGLVVGAVAAGEVVGFAFGFASTPHGRGMYGPGMHSHMAAVLPGFRRAGVGRRLKRYQASWCAARGLGWISWTFDPLRAENASFNLAILGARCYDYLQDFYGPMPGALGGGLESDRLLAVWRVADAARGDVEGAEQQGPEVRSEAGQAERLDVAPAEARRNPRGLARTAPVYVGSAPSSGAGGASAPTTTTLEHDSVWLLPPGDEPRVLEAAALEKALGTAGTLRVATPSARADVFSRPRLAIAWRHAHRQTLGAALERGWTVTGFRDGGYALRRWDPDTDPH